MEVKGLNVMQRPARFESDKRSDFGIRDFGRTDTHSIFYVEPLAKPDSKQKK